MAKTMTKKETAIVSKTMELLNSNKTAIEQKIAQVTALAGNVIEDKTIGNATFYKIACPYCGTIQDGNRYRDIVCNACGKNIRPYPRYISNVFLIKDGDDVYAISMDIGAEIKYDSNNIGELHFNGFYPDAVGVFHSDNTCEMYYFNYHENTAIKTNVGPVRLFRDRSKAVYGLNTSEIWGVQVNGAAAAFWYDVESQKLQKKPKATTATTKKVSVIPAIPDVDDTSFFPFLYNVYSVNYKEDKNEYEIWCRSCNNIFPYTGACYRHQDPAFGSTKGITCPHCGKHAALSSSKNILKMRKDGDNIELFAFWITANNYEVTCNPLMAYIITPKKDIKYKYDVFSKTLKESRARLNYQIDALDIDPAYSWMNIEKFCELLNRADVYQIISYIKACYKNTLITECVKHKDLLYLLEKEENLNYSGNSLAEVFGVDEQFWHDDMSEDEVLLYKAVSKMSLSSENINFLKKLKMSASLLQSVAEMWNPEEFVTTYREKYIYEGYNFYDAINMLSKYIAGYEKCQKKAPTALPDKLYDTRIFSTFLASSFMISREILSESVFSGSNISLPMPQMAVLSTLGRIEFYKINSDNSVTVYDKDKKEILTIDVDGKIL